ncbi:hypothetical protein [Sporomusa malonica]|uniref:hypothetical protein n=1 Tax=Sporomusa malonica TaxID=112901 RepID=UPI00111BE393|nr:hypothetical protein [Sporomusa malonica]
MIPWAGHGIHANARIPTTNPGKMANKGAMNHPALQAKPPNICLKEITNYTKFAADPSQRLYSIVSEVFFIYDTDAA